MAKTGRMLAVVTAVVGALVAAARVGAAADLTPIPRTETPEWHVRSSSPALTPRNPAKLFVDERHEPL